MKSCFTGSMCTAAVLSFSIAAFGQTTPPQAQPPAEPTAQAARQPADTAQQQITIIGCVQREADYRKSQSAGQGGAAGTGVGVGNEFVLVNASMPSPSTSSGAGTGTAAGATGTTGAGSTATGTAYELTGSEEGKAAAFVGKRVEITGKLKSSDPSGGPTAGAPPRGVDATSKDLKLREVEVVSVKEASGSCPTASQR